MTSELLPRSNDVDRFDFGFDEHWFQIPLSAPGGGWAKTLVRSFSLKRSISKSLISQLEKLQANLGATFEPRVTCVVWIPQPESGRAACSLSFQLSDLAESDSPDTVLADFKADKNHGDTTTDFLEVDPWRGEFDVGQFVAARRLILHRNAQDPEGTVEEQTVFVVFPSGARQMVQLVFTAASAGSFNDMSAETQAVASTLRVDLVPAH
jgi:hypothetical protein